MESHVPTEGDHSTLSTPRTTSESAPNTPSRTSLSRPIGIIVSLDPGRSHAPIAALAFWLLASGDIVLGLIAGVWVGRWGNVGVHWPAILAILRARARYPRGVVLGWQTGTWVVNR